MDQRGERPWKTDGKPPAMDKDTRNILLALSEIDTNRGRTRLDRLLKTILNADLTKEKQVDGQHSRFRSLLQSCATWERNTAISDFEHLMVLLQLTSYISRWVEATYLTIQCWLTLCSHKEDTKELQEIALEMELTRDMLWEYNHRGMRLAVLAASSKWQLSYCMLWCWIVKVHSTFSS